MGLDPSWTDRATYSLGRDPLGLQATSVRIYRSLVPGLTNVTNRLRYYSFYCWVIDLWEKQSYADSNRRWNSFIRRAEALYAIASFVADERQSGGLAGGDWAAVVDLRPDTLPTGILDLTIHDDPSTKGRYLGAPAGNFGQFYVASMLENRMLAPSRGVPLVSRELGRSMAKAFAEFAGEIALLVSDAIAGGAVKVSDLAKIGHSIGPFAIPKDFEEMTYLRGFLGGSGGGHQAIARRSSAWLVLDYMRRVQWQL